MTPTFNLVDQPWITCLDRTGATRTLSLRGVLTDAGDVCLAEADPLVEAAVWRLLTAICYAAGSHPADEDTYVEHILHPLPLDAAVSYLDIHYDEFDLFHPQTPIGQDATLGAAIRTPSLRPAVYLDCTAAIDGPLHSDTRHLLDPAPLTVGHAVRALLVENTWGFGGRTQGSDAELGAAKATNGLTSPLNGRIILCPTAATVAASLAWRVTPTANPGVPTWSYPSHPASGMPAFASEAAGLTWLSRRVLLVPSAHGSVSGVLVARGQGYLDIPKQQDVTGWSDVLLTPRTALSGLAIATSTDLLPIVAAFTHARPGSLVAHATAAAHTLGTGIDLTAISLVTPLRGKKKGDVARRVPVPAAALTTLNAAPLAAALLALRRSDHDVAPDLGVAEFLRWLHGPTQDVAAVLAAVRDQLLAHRHARGRTDSAAGTQAILRIHRSADKAATQLDTPLPPRARKDTVNPDDTLADQDIDDFADLFTQPTAARPAAAERTLPVEILIRRLWAYHHRPEYRGVLAELRRYALRPDPGNPAMQRVTRDLPADHLTAATTTAAVFATSAAPMTGHSRPLPRLARSFGSTKRGPANPQVRLLMQRALDAPAPGMLPILLHLIRQAPARGASVDWRHLYTSLLRWDDPDREARTQWALLFYSPRRLSDINSIVTTTIATKGHLS